jgi:methanogen homoaconitase small subunit
MGPDIDTDIIIAGRYLRTKDRKLWAEHAFEDLDPGIAGRLRHAVIVAGKNFGCGSSREQAAIALYEAGVAGVVAPSFARIFYRNAVNVGLPVVECECPCRPGVPVEADLGEGWVEVEGTRFAARHLSPRMIAILRAGGLVPFRRAKE